jgi:hypothetical protein
VKAGIPQPPVLSGFAPQLTFQGQDSQRRLILNASVVINGDYTSAVVGLDYVDANSDPANVEWELTGGVLDPVDLTPLLPNQRLTAYAQAANNELLSARLEVELDTVTLRGDINTDDVIDELDTTVLTPLIGLSTADAGYRPWYDTDENGVVDERDAAYLGYYYGATRPVE